MVQVVEPLLSKCEALTRAKKKEDRQEKLLQSLFLVLSSPRKSLPAIHLTRD
jgi:hypothetical protein